MALHSAADMLVALGQLEGCNEMAQSFEEDGMGADWYAAFTESLSPETRELVARVGSGDIWWISMIAILDEMPDSSTVTEFIDHVAETDPVALRRGLLALKEARDPEYERLAPAAAAGDREALSQLMALPGATGHKRWAESVQLLLELEPAETRELLVSAMRGVHADVFTKHEAEFRPSLERDIAARREMAKRLSAERFVEVTTNGISIEKQGIRRPILLLPSVVGRPWVIFTESPERMIMVYPVADEYMDADPDAPPNWLIKTYKALGDERRLRILRRLSKGNASLHELADELDVSKSTLHHHMMLLRSAGLVK
ncbi:MAG: winged helix-turn-helix domain-containing protein, partial [Actinomycetota bacterium]